MSFGKSARWCDWVPQNAFLAPGQRQDVLHDPEFSFAAAATATAAMPVPGAGFGSSAKRNLGGRRQRHRESMASAAGAHGHAATAPPPAGTAGAGGGGGGGEAPDYPPVFTQFGAHRRGSNVWGAPGSGTFGSSRRHVSVSGRAVRWRGVAVWCGVCGGVVVRCSVAWYDMQWRVQCAVM